MSQADSSSVTNGTTLADDAGGFQTEEPTGTKPPQRTDEDSGRSPKLWQHIAGWFDFGNTDPTSTAGAENPSEHVPGRTPSPDSATTDSEIHTPPPAKPLTGWAKSEPVKRDPTSWEPLATSPSAAADFGRFANPQAAQAVLAEIKADAAYNAIGKQDGKGVSGGESLWAGGSVGAIENSDNGPQDKRDLRQTPSAPPIYSLSPRRQTEDVPGKLLETLQRSPEHSDTGSNPFNTLVVDTHRLNQFPEQYAQRLADAAERGERVVVAASIGGSAGKNEDFAQEKATAQRDLRMLDNTIALLRAAGVPSENIDVVAGQADTPAKAFTAAQPDEQATREANVNELRLQTARGYNSILERHGLGDAAGREGQTVDETQGLPWGGDELASTAIARALPERSVNVIALDKDGNEVNPGTVANYWENNDATSRLIDDALAKNNLRQAEPGQAADMTMYVTLDKSNRQVAYSGNPEAIRQRIEGDFADHRSDPRSTMIVDLRTSNGAFDNRILPRDDDARVRDDLLAVGAWGTGANALGQTMAVGKVLQASGDSGAQRQLLIESVANDFVLRNQDAAANVMLPYGSKPVAEDGKHSIETSALNQSLRNAGIDMSDNWDASGSFDSLNEGRLARGVTEDYVNATLGQMFGEDTEVATTFQFNRVFEAHTQLADGTLSSRHSTQSALSDGA
jgi:Protein of unknown function (DUF4127)